LTSKDKFIEHLAPQEREKENIWKWTNFVLLRHIYPQRNSQMMEGHLIPKKNMSQFNLLLES
jgi:hypothetical protein